MTAEGRTITNNGSKKRETRTSYNNRGKQIQLAIRQTDAATTRQILDGHSVNIKGNQLGTVDRYKLGNPHSDSTMVTPHRVHDCVSLVSTTKVLVLNIVYRLINELAHSVHREPAVTGNIGDALRVRVLVVDRRPRQIFKQSVLGR